MPLSDTSVFGGVGFALGPPQNTFGTTAGVRSAAEGLRDAHFTANPGVLTAYELSDGLMIRLLFSGSPGVQYQVYVGGRWVDIQGIFQGPPGDDGTQGPMGAAGQNGFDGADGAAGSVGAQGSAGPAGSQGPQGIFYIRVYRNATSVPDTPVDGTYNVDNDTLVSPTDWAATATPIGTGERTYISEAIIDPSGQSGTVTPIWMVPYQAGYIGPEGPQGTTGPSGTNGSQGRFTIEAYRNSATIPITPVDGVYNVESGVLTPPIRLGHFSHHASGRREHL